MHVLRKAHSALRPRGLLLDAHPLGLDFCVRAGARGLGFVDASRFAEIVAAMDRRLRRVVREGLFVHVRTLRRHVAERFDNAADALDHAAGWSNLRLPPAVRRRLRQSEERPVEFVDTIEYRLLRKRSAARSPRAKLGHPRRRA